MTEFLLVGIFFVLVGYVLCMTFLGYRRDQLNLFGMANAIALALCIMFMDHNNPLSFLAIAFWAAGSTVYVGLYEMGLSSNPR